jgi:hypothetical protein
VLAPAGQVTDCALNIDAEAGRALDPGLAHQPGDSLEVHRQAQAQAQHELGVHPRRTLRAAGLLVDVFDVFKQQRVLLPPR